MRAPVILLDCTCLPEYAFIYVYIYIFISSLGALKGRFLLLRKLCVYYEKHRTAYKQNRGGSDNFTG